MTTLEFVNFYFGFILLLLVIIWMVTRKNYWRIGVGALVYLLHLTVSQN